MRKLLALLVILFGMGWFWLMVDFGDYRNRKVKHGPNYFI